MTVLTSNVRDIAGADDATVFTFEIPVVRGAADGGVVTVRSSRYTAEYGVLTTEDLEPGPAVCRLSGGLSAEYQITIPESSTPIQLWPLLEAGAPQAPEIAGRYVINAGGVARAQWISQANWSAIAPGDPDTTYYVYE